LAVLCCLLAGGVSGLAVMSVDLGCEWMKIAVVSPGVPMEIVLNPESKRKTSVAVSLQGGERKFGSDAMNVCVKSPKNCYTHLVDLLGKKTDNPMVELYKARFPHHNIRESDRGTVEFVLSDDVSYTVEELLGMIFSHAKLQAETYAEQKIKDAVITVPVYFNQAERLALINAAQLGGLNVLQLMSEPMSVALNYGMFRRKEINGTVRHMMMYDMGAQDTTVSVVAYQIVKIKEKGYTETHPQAQILGVGYDRTLGGSEITFKLREHLADEFDAMQKTKTKVRSVPRAMGKLLKEAEKVKIILSANSECYAQVENVMEDIDFKVKVEREKLVSIMGNTWERVTGPVHRALEAAAVPMDVIDQVILVGGGSRVPKVQELLTEFVSRELGKNLNTDESAAMGAVYKAADLSSGFKVKKFITKEAVVFPVDVNFERELGEEEEGFPGAKKVRRTLFSRMNPFPQKKIMTFNKHVKDFTFYVNYQDVEYLGPIEVGYLGAHNLTAVDVKGVAPALETNVGENIETKGVKAHFTLDDSGILSCTAVESVFEKTISVEEQEKLEAEKKENEDTWSKLGDTISQFFTTDKDKEGAEAGKEGEGNDEKKDKKAEEKKKKEEEKKKKEEEKKKKEEEKKEKEKKKEPKKPKVETIREELQMSEERVDVTPLTGSGLEASMAKLEVLNAADRERVARETALNELQSFVFDLNDKLYQEEYEAASTEEEREKMRTECSAVSDWLDEDVMPDTPLKEFNSRMKVLKDISAGLFARVREHRERPDALGALTKSFANAREFIEKSKNLTGEDGFFKEKELEALEKKADELTKWQEEKLAEQAAHPLSEMPKLTVSMIMQKVADLDGEVKFMVQKAKMVKAERERAKRLKEAEEKKAQEEAEKAAKKAAKAEKKAKKKKAKEEGKEGEEGKEEEGEESTTPADAENSSEKKPGEGEPSSSDTEGDTTTTTTQSDSDAALDSEAAAVDSDAADAAADVTEDSSDDVASEVPSDASNESDHTEL